MPPEYLCCVAPNQRWSNPWVNLWKLDGVDPCQKITKVQRPTIVKLIAVTSWWSSFRRLYHSRTMQSIFTTHKGKYWHVSERFSRLSSAPLFTIGYSGYIRPSATKNRLLSTAGTPLDIYWGILLGPGYSSDGCSSTQWRQPRSSKYPPASFRQHNFSWSPLSVSNRKVHRASSQKRLHLDRDL